jgi:hypothetical protein
MLATPFLSFFSYYTSVAIKPIRARAAAIADTTTSGALGIDFPEDHQRIIKIII